MTKDKSPPTDTAQTTLWDLVSRWGAKSDFNMYVVIAGIWGCFAIFGVAAAIFVWRFLV